MTAFFLKKICIVFRKQRQKDVSKFHIQLCCALIGMLLVFVIGIDRTESLGGCVTVSVLIHYFTLVAVMWMGAEALFMFHDCVCLNHHTLHHCCLHHLLGYVCMGHYIHVHVNVFFVPLSRSAGSCAGCAYPALNR